jgi:hypothetical protein
MVPKYLNSKNENQKKGRKFEKKTSRQTIGSGNKWFDPGDQVTATEMIEKKFTSKKSYAVTRELLKKLFYDAILASKTPILEVRIQDFIFVGQVFRDTEKL